MIIIYYLGIETVDVEGLISETPQLVQAMREVFKQNAKDDIEMNASHDEGNKNAINDKFNLSYELDSDEEMRINNYKFSAQEKLKGSKMILNEDNLRMKDQSLRAQLDSLIQRINENVNYLQGSRNRQLFNTQTAIISSFYNFPVKIVYNDEVLSIVPKAILKNKDIYEEIFSLLHLHPCYIMKIIDTYQFYTVSLIII